MTYSLAGKKVLYIAPQFFGYENEIRDELTRRGAMVDFLLDRPFSSPFLKAITRVRRQFVIGAADRYYQSELSKLGHKDYDFIFVISGQTLSTKTLSDWRARFKQARFCLYMWDSFENRPWAIENLTFFDQCFTFDRNDSARYNLHFRPLFFSSGFEEKSSMTSKFHISFVGTTHTDRYAIISAIKRQLSNNYTSLMYMFLQAKWVFWLYKVINSSFKSAHISEFKFQPLAKADVQEIFFSSKVILDIEHPQQTGLTMRTLETLGAKKKLVTTNADIKKYDFYQSENICIIDRHQPVLPDSFINTPYIDVSVEIYQKYRLSGWMDEILHSFK